jgi:hypothetical protein
LGISVDSVSNARFLEVQDFSQPISSISANPLIGLNYEINQSNTVRLAFQSYVNDHFLLNASSIAPPEVAGFPSWVNADDGTQVKDFGLLWESQWDPKTFTVLRLEADRIEDPEYSLNTPKNVVFDYRDESFGGSFTVNRLLSSCLGLSAGLSGKRVSLSAPPNVGNIGSTGDYIELSGDVQLKYQHPSGWFASIKDTVVHQDLGGLSDLSLKQAEFGNPFNLVDIGIGKYFDNKRGLVQLTITNIFNQHFYYQLEPVELSNFYPDREILFSLRLFF